MSEAHHAHAPEAPPPGSFAGPSLVFTDAAATKVASLIAEEGNPALKLRVFVQGGGCSGFQYGFSFEEGAEEGDFSVTNQGVTLVVDPMSFQYLMNAEFFNDAAPNEIYTLSRHDALPILSAFQLTVSGSTPSRSLPRTPALLGSTDLSAIFATAPKRAGMIHNSTISVHTTSTAAGASICACID